MKIQPIPYRHVREWGHKRVCIFKGAFEIETLSYCMLIAEFFCKSGQEFAFCRKTSIQVDHGGIKETWQTVGYWKCASTPIQRMKQELYKLFSFLIKRKEKTLKEGMVLNNGFSHLNVSFSHCTLLLGGFFLCCIKLGPDCHPNMATFDRLEPSSNTSKRWLCLSPLQPVAMLAHTTGLTQCLVQRHDNVSSKEEKQKKIWLSQSDNETSTSSVTSANS